MRLRQRDLRPYVVKKRIPKKEKDGTTYEEWEPNIVINPSWYGSTAVGGDKTYDGSKEYPGDSPGYLFWEDILGPAFSNINHANKDDYDFVVMANIQPAGGRQLSEMYGARLAYMLVAYLEPGAKIKENDGVCVNVRSDDKPDYRVVSVPRWGGHIVAHLEAIQ